MLNGTPDAVAGRATSRVSVMTSKLDELLAFEAPYLVTKLLRIGMAETAEEGRELLQEAKKYLVLTELHRNREVTNFSGRIDETWHQFILFTSEYTEFCERFVGRYFHHVPDESPISTRVVKTRSKMSFYEFKDAYEELFGPLPDLWHDELSVGLSSRVALAEPARAIRQGLAAQLCRADGSNTVLCRVNLRGFAALDFIARTSRLHVRELPGLDDGERVELCRTLTKFKVLDLLP